MKKRLALGLALVMSASMVFSACGGQKADTAATDDAKEEVVETAEEDADQVAADNCAALIDAIYVQERTDETDAQCAAAKEAWDGLTDAQKELVEGENADPDYFGRDTGDASQDDPLNQDEIGENEILVVSFGTSFNTSRVQDIGGIEKAIDAANKYLKDNNMQLNIEIETRSLDDVRRVLEHGGVQRIMFDNFTPDQIREGVKLVDHRMETEASGGIVKETLHDYAVTGVDFISVGALTHSVKGLDMSFKAC